MTMLSPKPRDMPDFVTKAVLRKFAENGWVIQRSMASMTSGRDLLDFRLHESAAADADCVGCEG